MNKQQLQIASESYAELDAYIQQNQIKRLLLVCDQSFMHLRISRNFDEIEQRLGIAIYKFDDFKPNPQYESVQKGVCFFQKFHCDSIIAIGGGSSIDVAKCIKLFAYMNPEDNLLNQQIVPNDIRLLAVPTTAGTGSESTHFAVIYYNGEKQSVTHDSCLPSTVLLDASTLKTLPMYQRKSTMLDALCHAIESFWSVNSTDESKTYSGQAIQMILKNKNLYLENNEIGNKNMLYASNLAGQAINIAQTTAGHAMSYKLTSLYSIAHGHAAALCLSRLWPYMIAHMEKCIDPRGQEYLQSVFTTLAKVMEQKTAMDAAISFQEIVRELDLPSPSIRSKNDYEILISSVNSVRLKNNPVLLERASLDFLYHQILERCSNGKE